MKGFDWVLILNQETNTKTRLGFIFHLRPRPRLVLTLICKWDQYQDLSWSESSVETKTNTWSWHLKSWFSISISRVSLNSDTNHLVSVLFTICLDPTLDYIIISWHRGSNTSCRSLSLSLPYHNGMVPAIIRTIGSFKRWNYIFFSSIFSKSKSLIKSNIVRRPALVAWLFTFTALLTEYNGMVTRGGAGWK